MKSRFLGLFFSPKFLRTSFEVREVNAIFIKLNFLYVILNCGKENDILLPCMDQTVLH